MLVTAKKLFASALLAGLVWGMSSAKVDAHDHCAVPPSPFGPHLIYAPMVGPAPCLPAPYGPEHVKYSYRHRPAIGVEKYETNLPGPFELELRQRSYPWGSRLSGRFGR